MDLDDLRGVQAGERSTDSLQSLSDSFYRDVVDYIEGLREERARAAERADDPFGSEEVRRLTDEIETAQEVAEAIYDRRIGKVVKRASLAAAGMPADEEGLTDEEARLFSDLVEQIESHRGSVLSAFAGEGAIETPDPVNAGEESTPSPKPSGGSAADAGPTGGGFDASAAMGGDAAPGADDPPATDRPPADNAPPPREDTPPGDGESPAGEHDTESGDDDAGELGRTTVRITRDVGEIMGVDEHVYELAAEDVVSLPRANAEPLIERDAASRLD